MNDKSDFDTEWGYEEKICEDCGTQMTVKLEKETAREYNFPRSDALECPECDEVEYECNCPDDVNIVPPPWKGGPLVENTEYCDHCKKRIRREYERLDGKADAIHDRLVSEGRR
jgi:hypothetical protein